MSSIKKILNQTLPQSAYDLMLEQEIDRMYKYGSQNKQNLASVADTVSTNDNYSPAPGAVGDLNWDAIKQAQIDRAVQTKALTAKGVFDNREIALDNVYNFLPSIDYLRNLALELQTELDSSVKQDKPHKDRVNNWQKWDAFKNTRDTMQEEEAFAYADYLLNGDTSSPFDMNAYNDAWNEMEDDEFFSTLDTLRRQYESIDWDKMTAKDASYEDSQYQSKTPSIQAKLDMTNKEIERRETLAALENEAMSAADFRNLSVYSGSTLSENAWLGSGGKVSQEDIEAINSAYSFINSGASWEQAHNAAEKMPTVSKYLSEGYDFMTQDEIAVYNYYYQRNDLDKAEQYLSALRPDLLYRRAMANNVYESTVSTNAWLAVPKFGDATLQGLWNLAYVPYQIYDAATGRDDPFSPAFDALNKQSFIRGAQLDAIADSGLPTVVNSVLQAVYKGTAGFADNAMRIVASGGNPTVALIMAGIQSGSGSLQESASRDDMSGAAKIIKAIGAAALEVGTEKIGLDALFDMGKAGALEYIKSVVLSELGEETINYVSQDALEAVVAFLFDHEAEIRSGEEFWHGLTDTWIQTALSSFMLGSVGSAQQGHQNKQYGSFVQQTADVDALLNIAEELGPKSKSYGQAKAIKDRLAAGKKMKLAELGAFSQALRADIGATNAKVADDITDRAIVKRLVELGTDRGTAQLNAPAVRKLANGEKLTAAERKAVSWDDNSTQVVTEMTRDIREGEENRAGNVWRNEYENELKTAQQKNLDKNLKYDRAMRPDKMTKAATAAADKKADELVKNAGNLKGKQFSATIEGRTVTGDVVRFEKGKAGLTAVLKNGDTEEKANVADITGAADKGSAAVLNYIRDDSNKHYLMTPVEASEMMAVYNQVGGDVNAFVQDYQDVYLSGYAGVEMAPSTMADGIAKVVYGYGVENAKTAETDRASKAGKQGTRGTGKTSWIGKVTESAQVGTQASEETLEAAKERMKPSQRLTVDIASALAKRMNIDVVFFESDLSAGNGIENGSFISGTNTIYIDINSGANSTAAVEAQTKNGTLGYAVLKTMSHELTHYMEANSAEGYATYKQAIKDALKAKNVSWEKLVRSKIDNAIRAGQKLTLQGAEAEVIADASEYMLQDSKFVQDLDNSIKGKIKTFVQNFVAEVKQIFQRLTGGHVESNALRDVFEGVVRYTGNLQKLWDAGMEDAIGTVGDGETVSIDELEPQKQFSMERGVEVRNDGLIAMHNVNADSLLKTLKLGGFPMASIAVVKSSQGHTQYGDYSVLFDKSTIDPKANKRNKVYGNDAWTPVFPADRVESELNTEKLQGIRGRIASSIESTSPELANSVDEFFEHFDGVKSLNLNTGLWDGVAWNNKGMVAAYLADQGVATNTNNLSELQALAPDGRDGMRAWLTEQLQEAGGTQGILKSKSQYDSKGREKAFKKTHVDVTAENIVKAMLEQGESTISPTSGAGLAYAGAPRYTSIDEIRANASRLSKVTDEEYNEMLDGITADLTDFLEGLTDEAYRQEEAGEALAKAAREGMDVNGIKAQLKKKGFRRVTAEQLDQAASLVERVRNLPTGYFEAKPERVIGIPEIKMIVTPQNMPAELGDLLDDLGIPHKPYNGTDADRLQKINETPNIQFSLRDSEYMEAVNSGDTVKAQQMVDEAAKRAGYTPLKLYHGTRNFGFKKFDINRMDDKMSIFVTDNERIAESYSGENPNRSLKDSVAAGDRHDFLNRPAGELESLVQEHVDKNLRVPTEKELRQFTDFESSTILSAVDRVNDYIQQIGENADIETRQALQNIVYYGEKLAQIPYADLEDETDAYKLRMKYSDAVLDLYFANRDIHDELASLVNRPVIDSANNLITARFNDPFYNEQTAEFTDKFNVTDKLGDKLFSGVYDLYADQSGLFVIDANDSNWNTIDGALIDRPGVRVLTRDVAAYAKQNGYKGAQIKNVRDSGGMTGYFGASDVYIFFDNTALKSADPVTYDNNGNVIPLSERFVSSNEDIRYSLREGESSPDGIEIDEAGGSAYKQTSIRTWDASDYVQKRDEMVDRLVKTLGVSKNTAKRWINDVNSISAIILGDKLRLDYVPTAVEGATAFKSNPEYGGSIDMSTICAKRRLATGTLDAIQERLGDAVLTKDDFLHIREMMKERNHEVACGLCFVESSRKNLSKYTAQFIDEFNASHPNNQVTMVDFNTVDGLERTRLYNTEAYSAYEKFMNKLAQRKPKLFEKRTEYQHEILKKFKKDTTVSIKNLNGGLRLQSFSDFEIVHLIDMMQVITDMASVGLAGQAYTKVPDFAWALGDTGLKINLSLIAKGVDADGNLIFDDVEGMNHKEARKLRDRYSKNVGTIVVTFTDDQLIAAMKNDMVDYIIPFHRSQWQKSDYKLLGLPESTKDYTLHQNEKEGGKRVKENFLPNAYWDFTISGKANAEKYLAMCAAAGRTPKFAKFLQKNSDGSYSLKPDGSTDGYWKLLIGFKMYDNDGVGSPQLPVTPDFNMKQAKRMLNEYTGEHDTFPVAQDVVDDFVKEYADRKGGVKLSSGKFSVQGAQFSLRDTEDTISVRDYLMEADESVANTIEEKNALSIYQERLRAHAEASDKVKEAEAALVGKTGDELKEAKGNLAAARARQNELFRRLTAVEKTHHVQSVLDRSEKFLREEIIGKTESQITEQIAQHEADIATLAAELQGLKGAARTQHEADIRSRERIVKQLRSDAAKKMAAMNLRYQQAADEIRTRHDINAEINKKGAHIKKIVKNLNDRIIHEGDYKNVKQELKPVVHALVQEFIGGFGNLVFDQKKADSLLATYVKLAEDDAAPEFYSDDVELWLKELSDMAKEDERLRMEGGSSLLARSEKLAVYTKVAEIADHIYHLVKSADEVFVNGKREFFGKYTEDVGNELKERDDSRLLVGVAGKAQKVFDDLIRRGNMIPQYFFESLKNNGLMRLYDSLQQGQREYAQSVLAGRRAVTEAKSKYNYYTWSHKPQVFRTKQGHDIALTVEQKLWVYATAKRESSNELAQTHHLDQGGFRYDKDSMPKKNFFEAMPGADRKHLLSAADVENITSTLTAEQKAYADELVEFLSTDMAAIGNEASMNLFGIEKYNEKYYFPFKTDSGDRYQSSAAGSASTTNDARVKHSSFTHALRRKANTALVMGDFTNVVADHINLMSTYASFVVPIESLNRVLNRKVEDDGTEVSIRSLIGRKYGDAAQKYIADLLKDLNGGPQVDNRGSLSWMLRAFKRSAVMGSLSVAVQQPTAYLRAFAYIHPKYFAHLTMQGANETWEKMLKYSGTAVIKDMGRFDVGMGKAADDWIANEGMEGYNIAKRAKFLLDQKGFKAMSDNMVEALTALPGVMDRVTWTHLWKAIEAEQHDLHPEMNVNSAGFLKLVGERFDDVVNHTQVYDSILSRSQNMRSKNALTQMSTAFMSESTLNANLYYSALRGGHGKAQAARMITAGIAANLAAAAFAAAVSAWRKEDDDRTALEKYLSAFASRAIDNLNPATMLPFVNDLWSIVSGYDVERTDWSVVADMAKYTETFFTKLTDSEKELKYTDIENFLGSLFNLAGIPYKNVSRDFRSAVNFVTSNHSMPSSAGVKYSLIEEINPFWQSTNKAYCQRFVAALVDGDKQEAYDLWDYMTNTKGVSQGSLEDNVRAALKAAVQSGSLTVSQATEILRKYVPYKNDKDNINKPQEWLKAK